MQELITVILATDEGARMKSTVTKVAHQVCGQSLLAYVSTAVTQAGTDSLVLVTDDRANVENLLSNDTPIVVQQKLGQGHAVFQTKDILYDKKGTVLILYGDMPLMTGDTLKAAYECHLMQGNQITLLTSDMDDPFGCDRIMRDQAGQVTTIVGHEAADDEQRLIREINSGVYFFNIEALLGVLSQIDDTDQKKCSLTDITKKMIANNQKAGAYKAKDPAEMMRVDDRMQLAQAESILLKRIIEKHMKNGVTFHLPETCMVHADVQIGKDTVIHPGTQLTGHTIIGEECQVGPYSRIEDGVLGNGVGFANSVMTQSQIGDNTEVGPFAYIRPGSKIGKNIKLGDFVEIKNSNIGDNTKISHLTYIGDADVGKNVNFGCGTVIVNYDGKKKHRTVVGDHAFVGCNVNLVSPVVIKDYAYIAAGSTITDEVPEYALAIARSRQTVIEDWVRKKGLDKK